MKQLVSAVRVLQNTHFPPFVKIACRHVTICDSHGLFFFSQAVALKMIF